MHLLKAVRSLAIVQSGKDLDAWARARGGTYVQERDESNMELQVRNRHYNWEVRRMNISEDQTGAEHESIRKGPLGGRCDSLGQIMVEVTGVSAADVEKSSLVVRPLREKEDKPTAPQPQHVGGNKAKPAEEQPVKNCLGNTISNGHAYLGLEVENKRKEDPVNELTQQLQNTHVADDTSDKESTALAIPILVGEHKRSTDETGRQIGRAHV